MKKLILLISVAAIAALFTLFQTDLSYANPSQSGSVKQVYNGKSFTLESGEKVRLASIQVPNIQEVSGLKRAGEPMGEQSHQALIDLIQNQTLTLTFSHEKIDRKGRLIALAALPDGRIVQEEMIQQGWALAYPFPDSGALMPKWQKLEAEARAAKRGIWQDSYWNPQSADGVDTKGNERYLLVEGRIDNAAKVKGGWFLNFDKDWKTDFTGVISKEDAKTYFKGFDIASLQGKRVRVRGWTYRNNGPAMDLHQPEQIELLD